MAGFSQLADALKSVIMSSSQMTRTEKEDFLANLASWPRIVDSVKRAQTRHRPRSNGETEDGESESPKSLVKT